MDPTIVAALITAGAAVIAAVISYVTGTEPPDHASGVPRDIHPTAAFSKPMDSASINTDTFKVLETIVRLPLQSDRTDQEWCPHRYLLPFQSPVRALLSFLLPP
jgi:hypothetical protein